MFITKAGILTTRALSCGYVQRQELNDCTLDLFMRDSVYHVRKVALNASDDLWLSFKTMAEARSKFNELKRQLMVVNHAHV